MVMGYVSNRLPRDQPGTSAGLTLCDNTVIVPSDRPGKRNAAGDGDAVDVVLTGHGVRYAAQQVRIQHAACCAGHKRAASAILRTIATYA